ncbi:uncharacterized protein ANIA_11643 [Aspergillus nidulans FGSC A4]|uniref:Uncharacterized protein n=1 Tax=Emericella nidulans (strain FGSC A4 / ATCC 38163 / CBS 112.46 / NRRL 194 / M139) TaxID=227321 RepID=C8VK38_EMENI|nr:hypothetical protein [Aspergillus nidulans FGSC A4]CBF82429.1 TPA: hypothetical protein ANIA_11643 [Aspergillus nidulans FGSC A4]
MLVEFLVNSLKNIQHLLPCQPLESWSLTSGTSTGTNNGLEPQTCFCVDHSVKEQ